MSIHNPNLTLIYGSELSLENQRIALNSYPHRYTGNHKPDWAREKMNNGNEYPVQFKDDNDWLRNTRFAVNKNGKMNKRINQCLSEPTWPNNPELRKKTH